MVNIEPSINRVLDVFFQHIPAAELRGTGVLTGTIGTTSFDLPDVSSVNYTTVYSVSFGIEDIGTIKVFEAGTAFNLSVKGDGSARVQLSGDGGATPFITAIESPFVFGVFTQLLLLGDGTWITSILPGNNQFQVRVQIKANVGTVNSKMVDNSNITAMYRLSIEV